MFIYSIYEYIYVYIIYILYVYIVRIYVYTAYCILYIYIYIYIYILTKMCDLKYMNKKNIWIICGYMDKIIHILRGTLGPKRLSNRN